MSPTRLSRLESAMRTVIAFNQVFNQHDIPGMLQLMSEDCVFENAYPAPDGKAYSGKQEITQFFQEFFCTSPHAQIQIEEIFGLGMRCIMRWRYDWEDLAGDKGHIRGVDIFKVENDAICEKLAYVKGSYGYEP